jgi:ABC-type proline/glycine betaine transport system permease subunit
MTFAVGLWATIVTWGTPTNQCDNIAGTCIHMRQHAAIFAIRMACAAAVAVPAAVLVVVARREPSRGRPVAALMVV